MSRRLTSEQAAVVEEAAERAEVDIRRDYTGRGPVEPGFGVVGESDDISEFFVLVAILDADLGLDLIRNVKHDQMGLRVISYWPGRDLD